MSSNIANIFSSSLYKMIMAMLILFYAPKSFSQKDNKIDSLIIQYNDQSISPEERVELLRKLSGRPITPPLERIKYADELILLSKKLNNPSARMQAHQNKAYSYSKMGDYDSDIRESLKAIAIADSLENPYEGVLYNHLGYTYSKVFNEPEAERSFRKGLTILSEMEEGERKYNI